MNATLLIPIALGGACGAVLRYVIVAIVARMAPALGWPMGILAVNVIGSFLIGVMVGWFLREAVEAKPALQAFLITGLLGGFTTFSAFSLESVNLLQRGETVPALGYMGLSVLLCVAACALGLFSIRVVT